MDQDASMLGGKWLSLSEMRDLEPRCRERAEMRLEYYEGTLITANDLLSRCH